MGRGIVSELMKEGPGNGIREKIGSGLEWVERRGECSRMKKCRIGVEDGQ